MHERGRASAQQRTRGRAPNLWGPSRRSRCLPRNAWAERGRTWRGRPRCGRPPAHLPGLQEWLVFGEAVPEAANRLVACSNAGPSPTTFKSKFPEPVLNLQRPRYFMSNLARAAIVASSARRQSLVRQLAQRSVCATSVAAEHLRRSSESAPHSRRAGHPTWSGHSHQTQHTNCPSGAARAHSQAALPALAPASGWMPKR